MMKTNKQEKHIQERVILSQLFPGLVSPPRYGNPAKEGTLEGSSIWSARNKLASAGPLC